MSSKYGIVALDMDGTLLTSKKSVHPDTIHDITEASEKGIHVIYCSGRAPIEMKEYLEILPTIRYAICMSGALVYDMKEQKTIYSCPVPKEYVKIIVEAANTEEVMVHFLTDNESIVREDQISHMKDFNMEVYQPMYYDIATTVPDMVKEAEKHESITKVNLYFGNQHARQEVYEKIKHLPLSFTITESTSIEITAQGVTKAKGLIELASYLNIPIEQTLGIGDAENDRSFLSIVGLSVAMGNASEGIKAICKVVTDDNDHNGTGKAIRKYCLDH